MPHPLAVLAFILLASAAYAAWRGAPWVPTKKGDASRLIALLGLKPGQRFVELGCGDGRVSAAVARATGADVTGVELSLLQFFAAWVRGAANGGSVAGAGGNLRFRLGDAFSADLSQADAVYLFLMPETYAKLRPKFERELKPGAKVVTYVWPMPEWEAERVDEKEGKPTLYLYIR